MNIPNLFSHPPEREFISSRDTSTEPVENPTFSDRPEANAPGTQRHRREPDGGDAPLDSPPSESP